MCENCGYSLNEGPNECLECDICIRNPKNLSKRFEPVQYKGLLIEKPIDMFISKEHLAMIILEIRKMYEQGLKDSTTPSWHPVFPKVPSSKPDDWYYPSYQSSNELISSTTFSQQKWNWSSDSLNITYTIKIPVICPADEPVKIIEIGKVIETPTKEKNIIKTVLINVEEILKGMEGVEVSEII